jgi:hypothetical protein
VWVSGDVNQKTPTLRVAPLGGGGLLRERLFGKHTTVLTDPLASARQKAVNSWGDNGFLRASRPPFWTTYDSEVVRAALKRLDAARTRQAQTR